MEALTTKDTKDTKRRKGLAFVSLVSFVVLLASLCPIAQELAKVPAETLLDRAVLKALDEELSGTAAKDHVAKVGAISFK